MPRNGSGQYSAPASSWNPGIDGNAATSADWNALLADITNALTQSVSRDGQSPFTGPLNMGGSRILNIGAAAADSDAVRRQQFTKGQTIPSASTISIPAEGSLFDITGDVSINGIANSVPGRIVAFRFFGTLVLNHSNTFQMPNQTSITTIPGDVAMFVLVDNNFWACISYPRSTSVPPGHFDMFFMSSPPPGYLECNGAAISRSGYQSLFSAIGTTYGAGNGSTTFNLPDMRGMFARSLDNGRGVDPGRAIGSTQDSANLSHSHNILDPGHGHTVPANVSNTFPAGSSLGTAAGNVGTGDTGTTLNFTGVSAQASGGTESRPRNVALLACIKY